MEVGVVKWLCTSLTAEVSILTNDMVLSKLLSDQRRYFDNLLNCIIYSVIQLTNRPLACF